VCVDDDVDIIILKKNEYPLGGIETIDKNENILFKVLRPLKIHLVHATVQKLLTLQKCKIQVHTEFVTSL
jgi:hypothetical protein